MVANAFNSAVEVFTNVSEITEFLLIVFYIYQLNLFENTGYFLFPAKLCVVVHQLLG